MSHARRNRYPNSHRPPASGPSPAPAEIAAARVAAGLTPAESAALVSADEAVWLRWERGDRPMSPGAWALFRGRLAPFHPGTPA